MFKTPKPSKSKCSICKEPLKKADATVFTHGNSPRHCFHAACLNVIATLIHRPLRPMEIVKLSEVEKYEEEQKQLTKTKDDFVNRTVTNHRKAKNKTA